MSTLPSLLFVILIWLSFRKVITIHEFSFVGYLFQRANDVLIWLSWLMALAALKPLDEGLSSDAFSLSRIWFLRLPVSLWFCSPLAHGRYYTSTAVLTRVQFYELSARSGTRGEELRSKKPWIFFVSRLFKRSRTPFKREATVRRRCQEKNDFQ